MRRITCSFLLAAAAAAALFAQSPARITRIEFSPAAEDDGGGILISLLGSGECTYTIDFGDGKTERRSATLPDRIRHAYAPDREYTVVATPDAPCEGTARARLDIRAITRGIWRLSVEPGPAADLPEIIVTVEGRGSCVVVLDFGDGTREKIEGTLPAKTSHKYAKAGAYDLHAAAQDPCRGEVLLNVDVRIQEPATR